MQSTVLFYYLVLLFSINGANNEWGFFAHKKINEIAIYILPNELQKFYKIHANEIIERSVAPDKRRYMIAEEGAKHYIDLDLYDSFPLPKYWKQAVDKYGEEYLKKRGINAWNSFFVYQQLVHAMATKNYSRIIKISADLGHYISDAHVPLHTTSNYNGQFTNQLGIHAFWESRLPELYFGTYDLFNQKSIYIEDIQGEIWNILTESNDLLEKVFELEDKITKKVGEDKKYAYMQKGKNIVRMPSEYYSSKFNKEGGRVVEERMRKAIYRVSSFWFSAWIDAGQPDLSSEANFSLEKKSEGKKRLFIITRKHDY